MRPIGVLAMLALSGCLDWGVSAITDPDGTTGDTDPDGGSDGSGNPGARDEICNGEDDDLDGLVDEDFPDVDGDGVADCRDEDCSVEMLDPRVIPTEPACATVEFPSPEHPFDLVVEWSWRDESTVSMPAIGLLNDDDGDGDVDVDDVPDIVFSTMTSGSIVALSGATHEVLWQVGGFRSDSGVAMADIDADGDIEVVAITRDDRIQALEADGTIAWTSADRFPMLYPVPTITDLEDDGLPEVVGDVGLVNGLDGSTRADLGLGRQGPWRAPVIVDLDRDGVDEILLGTTVFDNHGNVRWKTALTPGAVAAFPVPLQADDDPFPEIAWAVGNVLRIHEHDGTVVRELSLGGDRPGPPCAGDLDGDGWTEVVVPARDAITAYSVDGRALWSQPIEDSSGAAGCVVFDMDADRAWEVVYADMNTLRVFDGTTGAVRFRDTTHSSVTYFETPAIADVDQDGSAEIVVASSGFAGVRGITVFGHAEDGWPAAGPAWSVHDFQLTNTTPRGGVPRGEVPGWERYGLFRGRPSTDSGSLPDLAVSVDSMCLASCEPGGLLRLSWRAHNQGESRVPAGTEVALITALGKEETELRRVVLPELRPGMATASRTFDLPWSAVPEGGSVEVVIDPDDRVFECDEEDNRWVWNDGFCGR